MNPNGGARRRFCPFRPPMSCMVCARNSRPVRSPSGESTSTVHGVVGDGDGGWREHDRCRKVNYCGATKRAHTVSYVLLLHTGPTFFLHVQKRDRAANWVQSIARQDIFFVKKNKHEDFSEIGKCGGMQNSMSKVVSGNKQLPRRLRLLTPENIENPFPLHSFP